MNSAMQIAAMRKSDATTNVCIHTIFLRYLAMSFISDEKADYQCNQNNRNKDKGYKPKIPG
jgi:hypothetical protein